MKGRRKRLQIKKIQNTEGQWLEEDMLISREAIQFYQKEFTREEEATDFSFLDHVPELITAD